MAEGTPRFGFPKSFWLKESRVEMSREEYERRIGDATLAGMAFFQHRVAKKLGLTMAGAKRWLENKETQAVRNRPRPR